MVTTGEAAMTRLKQWGVTQIFGYPGDGINGLLKALQSMEGAPRFIQVRHEELAAFAACAYGKFTAPRGHARQPVWQPRHHGTRPAICVRGQDGPSRPPVIATTGDGTMQMNGMNVLIDVAKYWQEWENPTFVTIVLINSDLNQVTWEQRALSGCRKVAAFQELPTLDFAGYAKLLGVDGVRIEKPDDIVPALDAALLADRPTVIDALTDPEIPPIPPHVLPDQVKKLLSALRAGDPNARHLIGLGAKQKLAEFLPRH